MVAKIKVRGKKYQTLWANGYESSGGLVGAVGPKGDAFLMGGLGDKESMTFGKFTLYSPYGGGFPAGCLQNYDCLVYGFDVNYLVQINPEGIVVAATTNLLPVGTSGGGPPLGVDGKGYLYAIGPQIYGYYRNDEGQIVAEFPESAREVCGKVIDIGDAPDVIYTAKISSLDCKKTKCRAAKGCSK